MKSERMNRVLAVLEAHPMISTKEIEDMAQVAAARDYVRRLRDHGYIIEMVEQWVDGCRICRYSLKGDSWDGANASSEAPPTGQEDSCSPRRSGFGCP